MLSINIKYTTEDNKDVSRIFTTNEITIYERLDLTPVECHLEGTVEFLGIQDATKSTKVAVLEMDERTIVVGDGNIYVMNDKGSTIDRFAVWQYNKPI